MLPLPPEFEIQIWVTLCIASVIGLTSLLSNRRNRKLLWDIRLSKLGLWSLLALGLCLLDHFIFKRGNLPYLFATIPGVAIILGIAVWEYNDTRKTRPNFAQRFVFRVIVALISFVVVFSFLKVFLWLNWPIVNDPYTDICSNPKNWYYLDGQDYTQCVDDIKDRFFSSPPALNDPRNQTVYVIHDRKKQCQLPSPLNSTQTK